ncbi:hypothetical protein AANUM_0472 [Aggregatibacter actinomycetemcomitans NUM4039]|nr:hypothetical protein AANUM_0472 [Aggregatibacter actinomycetemcomitans NUM4039]
MALITKDWMKALPPPSPYNNATNAGSSMVQEKHITKMPTMRKMDKKCTKKSLYN